MICKGSIVIGTGCMSCEKCKTEWRRLRETGWRIVSPDDHAAITKVQNSKRSNHWNEAIRAAAEAARRRDRIGREFVPGSLWDKIKEETERDILKLLVDEEASDVPPPPEDRDRRKGGFGWPFSRMDTNDKLAKLAGLVMKCNMVSSQGDRTKKYARYCLKQIDRDPEAGR